MQIANSFKAAGAALRRGACVLAVAGVAAASPALAQGVDPITTAAIDPAVTTEINARLKQLAPIIRNAESERERLGIPVSARDTCSAQTGLFVEAIKAFKTDKDYSVALAHADMEDLQAMTQFATCTLPGGLNAKLNVCDAHSSNILMALVPDVFDPAMMDNRDFDTRCSHYKPKVASLN